MRLLTCLALLTATSPLWSQALPGMENPEEIRVRLFNDPVDDPVAFDRLLGVASDLGIESHLLLEAQMRFFLKTARWAEAETLRAPLRERAEDYPYGESVFFENESALEAGLLSLSAVAGYLDGDMERFEMDAKEGFWQDPSVTMYLIGGLIYQHREELRAAAFRVSMDTVLEPTAEGEAQPLAELVEGRKALLLDFWATWCMPCIALMPALQEKYDALEPQGVAVIAVNTDDKEKAVTIRDEREMTVTWLAESEGSNLSQSLQIDSIPRMVLISPEGRVLFNGHPQDEQLATALAAIGVEL